MAAADCRRIVANQRNSCFAKVSFRNIPGQASLAFSETAAGGAADRAKAAELILFHEVSGRASNALCLTYASLAAAGAGCAGFVDGQEEVRDTRVAVGRVLASGTSFGTECADEPVDILEESVSTSWAASAVAAQVIVG